jgi:cysteine-rich CPCC protein
MSDASKHPCPCCGYLTFDEAPGSDEICEICFWQDDISQLRFQSTGVGANRVSLIEGQHNFDKLGASELRLIPHVRMPRPVDERDPEWRPINERTDNIEMSVHGVDYGQTYPEDSTTLYYWRHTYWRK